MSKSLRIDSISVSNGVANIGVTYGSTPLPAQAAATGIHIPVPALKALAQNAESSDTLTSQLLFTLALCAYAAVDPTFSNPQLAVGHSVTVTLVGATPSIAFT